jgi:hypothetical protein
LNRWELARPWASPVTCEDKAYCPDTSSARESQSWRPQ